MITEKTFVEMWLSGHYPLTIIMDRYTGCYSGGIFIAFPLDFSQIPEEVSGDDSECAMFWQDNIIPVGKGTTMEEAYKDLVKKMESRLWDMKKESEAEDQVR